jgi:hypothetical protein
MHHQLSRLFYEEEEKFDADVIACSPSPVPPSLGMRKEVVSRQEAFTMIPSEKKSSCRIKVCICKLGPKNMYVRWYVGRLP